MAPLQTSLLIAPYTTLRQQAKPNTRVALPFGRKFPDGPSDNPPTDTLNGQPNTTSETQAAAQPQTQATGQPQTKARPAENPETQKIFGKTKRPTLQNFVDTLLQSNQQKQVRWTAIGTNLECTIGGFPLRLAETFTSPMRNQYRLQIFPKGFFSGFRSPLYNVDILSSDPMGAKVAQVYNLALKSLPELYDSDYSINKGLQLFDIGRSRLALVYHTDRNQAKAQASQEDVTFFVKPKSYYYGFQEVAADTQQANNPKATQQMTAAGNLQPVLAEGFISSTGYQPLTHRDSQGQIIKQGLSVEGFNAILNQAGITFSDLTEKASKLAEG